MFGNQEETPWAVALHRPKLLLTAIGSPFLIYIAWSNFHAAVSERSPTRHQAVRFADFSFSFLAFVVALFAGSWAYFLKVIFWRRNHRQSEP